MAQSRRSAPRDFERWCNAPPDAFDKLLTAGEVRSVRGNPEKLAEHRYRRLASHKAVLVAEYSFQAEVVPLARSAFLRTLITATGPTHFHRRLKVAVYVSFYLHMPRADYFKVLYGIHAVSYTHLTLPTN